MKHSLLALAAVAASLCLVVCEAACYAFAAIRRGVSWLSEAAFKPVQMSVQTAGFQLGPVVMLVAAAAYVANWLGRAMPRIECRWRMCPSA